MQFSIRYFNRKLEKIVHKTITITTATDEGGLESAIIASLPTDSLILDVAIYGVRYKPTIAIQHHFDFTGNTSAEVLADDFPDFSIPQVMVKNKAKIFRDIIENGVTIPENPHKITDLNGFKVKMITPAEIIQFQTLGLTPPQMKTIMAKLKRGANANTLYQIIYTLRGLGLPNEQITKILKAKTF